LELLQQLTLFVQLLRMLMETFGVELHTFMHQPPLMLASLVQMQLQLLVPTTQHTASMHAQ